MTLSSCLNTDALRAIGLSDERWQQLLEWPAAPTDTPMRVVEVHRDHVLLHDGLREHRARVAQALGLHLQQAGDALAVGDWVLAATDDFGGWHVCERLPPANQLARLVNDGRGAPRRQVLVANVDTALLLMGLDHDFNLRRLERYLALAQATAVAPLLLLTKADTVPEARVAQCLQRVAAAWPAGRPAWAVDARSAEVARRLSPWLGRGRTLVMLGSSGVGKSTLTNTLLGQAQQVAGAVRVHDSRGHHTTTVRSLYALPGGACVIDTPGLRGLRLDVGGSRALDAAFDDVAQAAVRCRFRDCRHRAEPGCAVREAVDPARLRNYQKLLREAQRDRFSALQQHELRALWKWRSRDARRRAQQP